MNKENGRLDPADEKEYAGMVGKEFECWKCGHTEMRKNVEFGAVINCPACKEGTMTEKLDPPMCGGCPGCS
jgi:hypothetical protein